MVKVRKHKRGWYQVDIRLRLPDGTRFRERTKAPVQSRSAAQRWGEARAREIFLTGPPVPEREVPTLQEFAPRYIEEGRANRQKASTVAAKDRILKVHLLPLLGSRRLDEIRNVDVSKLKAALAGKATKTVNNILAVLGRLLKVAVEWDVIDVMPCTVRLLKAPSFEARFFDFAEMERLVEAARVTDARAHVAVLLGGEAGLRLGEMLALRWTDVDLERRMLRIELANWYGTVDVPKGGRGRVVHLTARLAAALRAHRHLRGPLVLCEPDGSALTQRLLQGLVGRACRKANLAEGVHVLRHSFCSHLAMKGVPARTIQALAGHASITTTQRYMHLSPRALEEGIRALEGAEFVAGRGNIVATAEVDSGKSNG
jgi:integrase